MSKFYRPARYDAKSAQDGKWFTIVDDATDFEYGQFKLRLFDRNNTVTAKQIDAISRRLKNSDSKLTANELGKRAMIEYALLDWKLPVDPSDKKAEPVEFSLEAAYEYFDLEDASATYVFNALFQIASDVLNFPAETSAEVSEDTKKK